MAEVAPLVARLSLDDRLSGGVNKALSSVGRLEGGLGRAGKGVGQLATGMARAGVLIGGAVVTGLTAAAKVAGDFEAQMNTINTIAQATGTSVSGNLGKIGDGIRQVARDTNLPLADLTSAYYDLLSAGIKVSDAQGLLANSVTLGIGALGTTTETVNLLTTAYNAYGLDAKGAAVATDQFAQAVADGKVKVSEIAATFSNIAPVAKSAGIGINQIAAAYGYLTAQGVDASSVTVDMQRAILELMKPSAALVGLQKKLGKNYADLARSKGLVPALEQLRIDAKKAGVPVTDLFGRVQAIQFLLQTTGDKYSGFLAEQANIANSTGEAARQAEERQKGLNYQIGRLKNNLLDAGITLASGFTPAIGRAADKLSKLLNTDAFRSKLVAIGEKIGKSIDGIDWDKVVSGAQSFVDALQPALTIALKILDTLNALPAEVKGAGLGLLAVNKLSGGLVAQGGANILGGVGSTLARGALSKVPGVGALTSTPVYVTNWPAGGIGGGAGGAAGGGVGIAGLLGIGAAGAAGVGAAAIVKTIEDQLSTTLGGGDAGKTSAFKGVGDLSRGVAFGPFETLLQLPDTMRKIGDFITGTKAGGSATGAKVQLDSLSEQHLRTIAQNTSQGESLAAFRAAERASEATAAGMASADAKLSQIRDKRDSFNVHVNAPVTVNTSVSVRDYNVAARSSKRINRFTSLMAS